MRTRCCVHSHASFPTHLAHTHVRVVLGLQRLDSCIMGRLVWGDMCEMQCLSSGGWGVWYLSLTQLLLSSEQLGLDACNLLSLGLVTVIGMSRQYEPRCREVWHTWISASVLLRKSRSASSCSRLVHNV